MGRPAGPSVSRRYTETSQSVGGVVDDDLEITEDVEPIDEETLVAQGDTWDIKKNEGTGA